MFICLHTLSLLLSFFSSPSVVKPLHTQNLSLPLSRHKAMADKHFLSIIGEMDRLWYRQVILFSQPTTLVSVSPKPVIISESPSSSSSSILSLQDEETSADESPSSDKQVSSSESISLPLQDGSIDKKEERLDRMKNNHLGNRIRSHSSSPSTQNRHRKLKKPSKLEKSMSCRTLGELELDEVKGFMDLGFIFKKEYINPRIISVVPGLQRLCSQQIDATKNDIEAEVAEAEEEKEEEKRDVMRPYLSEAWLIKRPDSPLLNLKIPKPCSASNMKKHLRFWAKTVASEIQQE